MTFAHPLLLLVALAAPLVFVLERRGSRARRQALADFAAPELVARTSSVPTIPGETAAPLASRPRCTGVGAGAGATPVGTAPGAARANWPRHHRGPRPLPLDAGRRCRRDSARARQATRLAARRGFPWRPDRSRGFRWRRIPSASAHDRLRNLPALPQRRVARSDRRPRHRSLGTDQGRPAYAQS